MAGIVPPRGARTGRARRTGARVDRRLSRGLARRWRGCSGSRPRSPPSPRPRPPTGGAEELLSTSIPAIAAAAGSRLIKMLNTPGLMVRSATSSRSRGSPSSSGRPRRRASGSAGRAGPSRRPGGPRRAAARSPPRSPSRVRRGRATGVRSARSAGCTPPSTRPRPGRSRRPTGRAGRLEAEQHHADRGQAHPQQVAGTARHHHGQQQGPANSMVTASPRGIRAKDW